MCLAYSTALIVGCGDIAIASARLIGRRHALLLTDIDITRLNAAAAQLQNEGYSVDSFQCDIIDPHAVERLANYIRQRAQLGAIAHVAALAPSAGDWRKLMAVNLVGPHLIAREVGPQLLTDGVAVFVGSVAAYLTDMDPNLSKVLAAPLSKSFWNELEATAPSPITPSLAYLYSKAALVAWCERLATEWGPRRVRAVSVSPGLIRSSMGARERAHNPDSGRFVEHTPLGREGSIAEAAQAIDFATSASFLNGVDLLVDGGLRGALRTAQHSTTNVQAEISPATNQRTPTRS